MTRQGFTIAVIAVLFGLFILGASPLFVVDVTQTAIVVQLGKPVRTVMEPGLYVKVPFVQEVTYFDKRLLDWEPEVKFVDGLHRTIDWYFAVKDRTQLAAHLERKLTER